MYKRHLLVSFLSVVFSGVAIQCAHRQFEQNSDSDPEKLVAGNESIGDYAFKHGNMTVGDFIGLQPGEIALTLDDGPKPGSEKLAETLAKMNVPVTYFMIGQNAEKNLNLVKTIANLKFPNGKPATIIANHSWDHKGPTGKTNIAYSAPAAIDDIYEADKVLAPFIIAQNKPFLFRAPGGNFFANSGKGKTSLEEVNKKLSRYIGPFRWDVSGDAGSCSGAKECLDSYKYQVAIRGAKHGLVILAHDVQNQTREFMPQFVKDIQATKRKDGKKNVFVALDKYPDKLAKFGTLPQNEINMTNVSFDTNKSANGFVFKVGVKDATTINVYIDGSEKPFLTSSSAEFTVEKNLSQLGTREFLIKGYDASGKVIAKSLRFAHFSKDGAIAN